jgi:hypothetical protein
MFACCGHESDRLLIARPFPVLLPRNNSASSDAANRRLANKIFAFA